MGQLSEPLEKGNTNPRSVEYTSGLLASHKNRHTALTMSHVGAMQSVDLGSHEKTAPAADVVPHVMVEEEPKYTPVDTEKATSWSGSPAAWARHCVKLKASVAEQNVVPAVEHVVFVVDCHAPSLQEPLVHEPTVMSGHSFTVDDTKNPLPHGTEHREKAPKSFPMHCSVQSGRALHVNEYKSWLRVHLDPFPLWD
jgi:hypothetical protein